MSNLPKPCVTFQFEVQRILGISVDGNYQVQWAPAWVSKFYLVGCEHLIQDFLEEEQQQQQQQQEQQALEAQQQRQQETCSEVKHYPNGQLQMQGSVNVVTDDDQINGTGRILQHEQSLLHHSDYSVQVKTEENDMDIFRPFDDDTASNDNIVSAPRMSPNENELPESSAERSSMISLKEHIKQTRYSHESGATTHSKRKKTKYDSFQLSKDSLEKTSVDSVENNCFAGVSEIFMDTSSSLSIQTGNGSTFNSFPTRSEQDGDFDVKYETWTSSVGLKQGRSIDAVKSPLLKASTNSEAKKGVEENQNEDGKHHLDIESNRGKDAYNEAGTHSNTPETDREKNISKSSKKRKPPSLKHPLIAGNETPSCDCSKKCVSIISFEIQQQIHDAFWKIEDHKERRKWIFGRIEQKAVKVRRVTTASECAKQRNVTRVYSFLVGGVDKVVCKRFFLSTLGYKHDTILTNLFNSLSP